MARKYVPMPIRRLVRLRAAERCEYCRMPEAFALVSHWVDHVVAEKHGGETAEENLALSCSMCNQHKGTDLSSIDPETGLVQELFNPRRDRWPDHFQMDGARIEPLTAAGRVTVRLLQLNRPDRLSMREAVLKAGALDSDPDRQEGDHALG
ncbi:MAG: HNH endonuclease [Gemmataceae bacterium]|nr:HNH endonuclease [Gemmataceae bacterium]